MYIASSPWHNATHSEYISHLHAKHSAVALEMAIARRFSVYLIVAVVLFSGTTISSLAEDPELKQCLHQCRHQEQYDERQRRMCEKQCEDYYEKKHGDRPEEEEREDNPYVFQESFSTKIETRDGKIGLLQRFNERSPLLKGIEDYRIWFLEANPRTFIIPAHLDADSVFFVSQGRAHIKLVEGNKLGNVEVSEGDILRVEAGTTGYIINTDKQEKLRIVGLFKSASIPGKVEGFVGAGGENPESFYRAFNEDLLSAALNTKKDALRNILRKQNKGVMFKASDEQIKSLAGRSSRQSFNLLKKKPSKGNEHGKLHEADSHDYDHLKDLDIGLAFLNLTQGSMAGPFYNSRATKIAIVVSGRGYIEIVCPHLASSEKRSHGPAYEAVSAELRPGTVFVLPAGHPVAMVASTGRAEESLEGSENLEVLCFDVNHHGNTRYVLAGKNNVLDQLEVAAKELAFNAPVREVDEMLQSQTMEYFFQGPQDWRRPGIRSVV